MKMKTVNKYNFLNIEKIVQVFFYIQKNTGADTKLNLIKLLFFADKIHLRKHFSFISLDNYIALKYGPVARISLDILNRQKEYLSNFSTNELKYLDNVQKINQSKRIIRQMPNDLLSKNEMNSIDKSINLFFGKNLVDLSHDYPEWKRYKEPFEMQWVSSMPIVINDFFRNPDINNSPAIKKYFGDTDPLYEEEGFLEEAELFYMQSIGKYAL